MLPGGGPTHAPAQRPPGVDRPLAPAGPWISVVINTCDREGPLSALLDALERQTYPRFEVVVVVGPTRDRTRELVRARLGERVVLLDCPEFNLAISRNIGVEAAAGEVVAFADDDAIPCPTWLEQLAEAYLDPTTDGVGGRTYDASAGSGELQFLHGSMSDLAAQLDVREGAGPVVADRASGVYPRFHGTNMSFRVAALRAIDGFDEAFEYTFEDADASVRVAASGGRLVQLAGATVHHLPARGRNRGAELHTYAWTSWLRAKLYFTLKNGRTRGLGTAVRRAFEHVRVALRENDDRRGRGDVPARSVALIDAQLRQAVPQGFARGLLRPRRLRPLRQCARPVRPFGPLRSDEPGRLRLALLSRDYPPEQTEGVARSSHALAVGLAALGHDVHVVRGGASTRCVLSGGVLVHTVAPSAVPPSRSAQLLGHADADAFLRHGRAVRLELRRIARDHRLQLADSPLWGLDGLETALTGELPVVVRMLTAVQGSTEAQGPPTRESELLGGLERALLRAASLVVSNSRASTRSQGEVSGLDVAADRLAVAPYGIVPSAEGSVVPLDGVARRDPVVLVVGPLEARKGIPELLGAIPRVLEAFPRARFRIAGRDLRGGDALRAATGLDYQGYFRARYPRAASSVEFLGHVPGSTLPGLYRSCDLLVCPSRESFGMVLLEAMDQARPVLAGRAGGPEEIVVPGETGLLVDVAAPEALAAAIVELLGAPDRARAMGLAGRRRLLGGFTHIHMARAFEAAYGRLVGPR